MLTGVTPDNDVYREELFGPIAMVFKTSSEEDAVTIANDTPFGLGSYLFTTDAKQAARVADEIDAGMVFVNGVLLDGAELRSAAPSAPASAVSWAATAWMSSSTRS